MRLKYFHRLFTTRRGFLMCWCECLAQHCLANFESNNLVEHENFRLSFEMDIFNHVLKIEKKNRMQNLRLSR